MMMRVMARMDRLIRNTMKKDFRLGENFLC